MAVTRLSPGVYSVNGKRVNAASKDEALKKGGGGASPQAPSSPAKGSSGAFSGVKDKAVRGMLNDERAVQDYQAGQNFQYNNPNQITPFGQRNVTRDANGNVVVNDSLDSKQQLLVDQDAQLSASGRAIAQGMFGNIMGGGTDSLTPRTNTQALDADRQRIEKEVYGRLTRPIEEEYGQSKTQLDQRLRNSGNPPGSPRYETEMKQLEDRFDSRRREAQGQAVQTGGDELSRSFGLDETRRADQLNELGTFANFGSGVRAPSFQGYQGSQVNFSNPSEISLQLKNLQQQQQQLEAAMRRMNSGGGGGGGTPASTSPFYG